MFILCSYIQWSISINRQTYSQRRYREQFLNEPVQKDNEYSINDNNLKYRHLQEYFENELNSLEFSTCTNCSREVNYYNNNKTELCQQCKRSDKIHSSKQNGSKNSSSKIPRFNLYKTTFD